MSEPLSRGLEAGEHWKALDAAPRPMSEPVEFRARTKEIGGVRFQVPLADKMSWVRVEAAKATRKALDGLEGDDARPGSPLYDEEYNTQRATHLLSIACYQAGDARFLAFHNPAAVREKLTDDEIVLLLRAEATFRHESGPMITELSAPEMDAHLDAVMAARREGSDKRGRMILARLSDESMSDLMMHAVDRLLALEPRGAEVLPEENAPLVDPAAGATSSEPGFQDAPQTPEGP